MSRSTTRCGKGWNYAFEQDRSESSVNGNNASYKALNVRFQALLPYFEKEGYEIYNCTPGSGLEVFPHVAFEDAVAAATGVVPKRIVTSGMYDRAARERQQAADEAASSRASSRQASSPEAPSAEVFSAVRSRVVVRDKSLRGEERRRSRLNGRAARYV